jgi:hypothetical protein
MLPSSAMSLRARRSWLIGAALAVVGCLSPTLPLPPPAEPSITGPDAQGSYELDGFVEPQSEVYAYNTRTQQIFGEHTDTGQYHFAVVAQLNDDITFWYINGTDESPTIDFVIK